VSPVYDLGGERIRRKNFYMPCAIGPRFDSASPEEQARILKETWWCDLVSGSEWKALMQEPDFSPSAKSRLRRKAVGWLVVLGRIALLNPELYNSIVKDAEDLYRTQIGTDHPIIAIGTRTEVA
jgi:hypothetical protein